MLLHVRRQASACLYLLIITMFSAGCDKKLECGTALLVNDRTFSVKITEKGELGPAGGLLGSIPASSVPFGGALYDLVELAMESSFDPSVNFSAAQKARLERQASNAALSFLKNNKDAQALCHKCEDGKNCGLVGEHVIALSYLSARRLAPNVIEAFFRIKSGTIRCKPCPNCVLPPSDLDGMFSGNADGELQQDYCPNDVITLEEFLADDPVGMAILNMLE